MVEKKVYNSWAFTENQKEKGKMNFEIYKELTAVHKVSRRDFNIDDFDIVIVRKPGYKSSTYRVLKNEPGLNTDELLLLCDGGNLCFGGRRESSDTFVVWED